MNIKISSKDLCECGHDRESHPRKPCVVGWDGIENRRVCRCIKFKVHKSQNEVRFR